MAHTHTRVHSERTVLDFEPYDLLQHYPNLPSWAVDAFQSLKGPRQCWTPEARALLNTAYVPPVGMPVKTSALHVGTLSEDLKDSFASEEAWLGAKMEIDLWRLGRDLIRAKNEGWEQSAGTSRAGGPHETET